jgi:carbon storage regulator
MLVLTRRPGEEIFIGRNIRLTVVSIGPGRIKLGITAPRDVRIDRQEIAEMLAAQLQQQGDTTSPTTQSPPPVVTAVTAPAPVPVPQGGPVPAPKQSAAKPVVRRRRRRI